MGDYNTAKCNDLRLEEGQQDYDLQFESMKNYTCTNPNDFGSLRNYCNDLRQKLIKCERSKKIK